LVKKFVKGRGGVGLAIGIAAIAVTVIALFLPWYAITASSELGPLAQEGGATLMTMDGIRGVNVNMFVSAEGTDSTSGYASLFSTQMPFAIILMAGILLLALDIVGVKSGKGLGRKFWFGIIDVLLPIIFILIFISQLPAFMPYAYGMFPGQAMPRQVEDAVRSIAASPVFGTTNAEFPVVGYTTVSWGLGIGAYLLIVVAILRLVAGLMMRSAPDLQKTQPALPPPPP
jgi:cellulose synthase/poly-beta-1,6-N-acetylglucosamine synthase-like glycosyltransferase